MPPSWASVPNVKSAIRERLWLYAPGMHRSELVRWLSAYEPRPDEGDVVERFRALVDCPGDIFSRNHFKPGHVTASAIVVNADMSEVLLIDHRKLKRWLQPGGHVETSDRSLTDAAVREVLEECGPLRLESSGLIDIDVHSIPALGLEPAHDHYDVRFLLRATGGQLADTGEVNAVQWFPPNGVPASVDASVVRLIDKVVAQAP